MKMMMMIMTMVDDMNIDFVKKIVDNILPKFYFFLFFKTQQCPTF